MWTVFNWIISYHRKKGLWTYKPVYVGWMQNAYHNEMIVNVKATLNKNDESASFID